MKQNRIEPTHTRAHTHTYIQQLQHTLMHNTGYRVLCEYTRDGTTRTVSKRFEDFAALHRKVMNSLGLAQQVRRRRLFYSASSSSLLLCVGALAYLSQATQDCNTTALRVCLLDCSPLLFCVVVVGARCWRCGSTSSSVGFLHERFLDIIKIHHFSYSQTTQKA